MKQDEKKQGQNIYEASFNKAAEILRTSDLDQICRICGTSLKGSDIIVRFFNEEYTIQMPRVVFQPPTLSIYEHILILHYLTTLKDHSTKGEYVSFKNLPGAFFYNSTYRKRGPGQIVRKFGSNIKKIIEAAEKIGGRKADYGDVSVKLNVFPELEAVVVMYREDDEFPPEANILYKDDIINFLPLEDIAVLSGLIAGRLRQASA